MDILAKDLDEGKVSDAVPVKRKPDGWRGGFTKTENRMFWQGMNLTSDARVIYWTLKSFENADTKQCNPSYPKIMERSGLSRDRVAAALKELEHFSWIDKAKRFSGSTFYRLSWPSRLIYDADGNEVGRDPNQICPTKDEAKRYSERLRTKNKYRKKGGWSEWVKAEAKKAEDREAKWEEEIPF